MVMTWSKFKGTIKGAGFEANVEMMDLHEPFWQARMTWLTPESSEARVESFEEGKLEQAYEWCKKQIIQYEGRQKLNRINT